MLYTEIKTKAGKEKIKQINAMKPVTARLLLPPQNAYLLMVIKSKSYVAVAGALKHCCCHNEK